MPQLSGNEPILGLNTKRKNRAIVGAARAMLHDQGLPLFLWVEACNTVVYLQNRSPHRVLGDVGYSETSKALCIYIHSLRKTILRRDVRFEEDGAFRKSRGSERGEQSSPQI
jgi:hypothetical protein